MSFIPEISGIRRDLEPIRGDRFRVEPAPAWVVRRKVMNITRRPGEPVSILLIDRQINAPANSRYTRMVRRLETHQAVQDLGKIELGFDPATQCLLVHGVSVFREGKLVNHAVESAFELFQREATLDQDVLNGVVSAMLVLRDIRVGDVLDVEFSVHSDSSLFGDHYWWSEQTEGFQPVGRLWLSWIERENQHLSVRQSPACPPCERSHGEFGHVRTWSVEHAPAVALEPDMPAAYRPFAEISLSTFPDWRSVAGLFLEGWNREPADRSELDMELSSLRDRFAADPLAAISAAIDLVRHQVRYLGYSPGILGLIPADPGEVWHRRFGDCKEKSRLLCWLLGNLGVDADPVLVQTMWGAALPELLPSPGAFNHVVVRWRWNDREHWTDPTDVSRGGRVDDWTFLPFLHGLPLTSDAIGLVEIPGEPRNASGLEVDEQIEVSGNTQSGSVMVTHVYRGSAADMVRHFLDSRGRTMVADYLDDQVKRTRRNSAPTGELEVADDPVLNQLVLSRAYSCDELLVSSPAGDVDVLPLVPHSIPQRITGVSSTNRVHPLAIQHPVNVTHRIRVAGEQARKAGIAPHVIVNEFLKLSFSTTTNRAGSVHTFTLVSYRPEVPAAKVKAYVKDLGRIGEALDWHIRFPTRTKRGHPLKRSDNHPGNW